VRVERACDNARRIADYLCGNKNVERVMYPGLKNNEGHDVAKEQMSDFGMMVSINVRAGAKAAENFINSLKLWYLATSLVSGVHGFISGTGFACELFGGAVRLLDVSAATVRLSVGIESCEDLIADLEQALKNGEIGTKVYVPLTQSGDCI